MSTKVKGEAIKEGSVPLSALMNNEYILSDAVPAGINIGNIFKNNDYFNNSLLESRKEVFIKAESYKGVIPLIKGVTITLKHGPRAELTWDEHGIKIDSSANYYLPKIYSGFDKAVPNWDELDGGSPEYIKNRTHYEIKASAEVYIEELNASESINFTYNFHHLKNPKKIIIEYNQLEWDGEGDDYFEDSYSGNVEFLIPQEEYVSDTIQFNDSTTYCNLSINAGVIEMFHLCSAYNIKDGNFKITVEYEPKQLDEKFIPDTIARKSDIPDIDPVVWKYMCEPLVIENGKSVPNELIGEFNEDEGDRYNLKYPYKNMYVLITRGYYLNAIDAQETGISIQGCIKDSNIEFINIGAYIDSDKKWSVS